MDTEKEPGSSASVQFDSRITQIHPGAGEIHAEMKMTKEEEMRGDNFTRSDHKPSKDEQLLEEERYLLAKIHLMTGDTSPASCPHSLKRLLPAAGDVDCDVTEGQSEIPPEPTDPNPYTVIPCFESLQEISLTEESVRDEHV